MTESSGDFNSRFVGGVSSILLPQDKVRLNVQSEDRNIPQEKTPTEQKQQQRLQPHNSDLQKPFDLTNSTNSLIERNFTSNSFNEMPHNFEKVYPYSSTTAGYFNKTKSRRQSTLGTIQTTSSLIQNKCNCNTSTNAENDKTVNNDWHTSAVSNNSCGFGEDAEDENNPSSFSISSSATITSLPSSELDGLWEQYVERNLFFF